MVGRTLACYSARDFEAGLWANFVFERCTGVETTGLAIYCPLAFLDAGARLGCCCACVGFAAMTGALFLLVDIEDDPFEALNQGRYAVSEISAHRHLTPGSSPNRRGDVQRHSWQKPRRRSAETASIGRRDICLLPTLIWSITYL